MWLRNYWILCDTYGTYMEYHGIIMNSRMKPSPILPEIGGINIIPKLVGLLLALPHILTSVDALFFGEEHTTLSGKIFWQT